MGTIPRIPWPLIRIDKEEDLAGKEVTLPLLSEHYGTFQVRSTGTDRIGRRKFNNRIGIQTDLGDIEIHLWKNLVLKCIEKAGEKTLYQHLLAWTMKHNIVEQSKEDTEEDAMHDFIRRHFDDPQWEHFIAFNRKYRPEFLSQFELVRIKHLCCNYIEEATRARADQLKETELRCRRCSKTAPYKILECENE